MTESRLFPVGLIADARNALEELGLYRHEALINALNEWIDGGEAMKARRITNGPEMMQAVQDLESRLRRMAKCDALAERHAGTARGRRLEEQAGQEEREVDALRAALIAFGRTLPG